MTEGGRLSILASRLRAARRLLMPGVQMPVYLLVFVTSRCDARCRHCFYWRELNTVRNELTVDEYERLARFAGPTFQVTLTGGNPELRTDLAQIAQVFYRHCHPANMTLCLLGRHTERVIQQVRDVLRLCPGLHLTVGLSLDGLGEEHDRLRVCPGLFERLQTTFAQLGEVKRQNPLLSVSAAITVSGLNHASAEETAQWAWENLPIDTLKPILIRGVPADASAIDGACRDPYLRIIDRDRHRLRSGRRTRPSLVTDLIDAKELVQRELIARIVTEGVAPATCSAARETAVIYPDGEVAGCEPRPEVLGNLREVGMDLRRVWFSDAADRFRRTSGHVGVCSGCYHHCFISPPIFRSPQLWPKLARTLWQNSRT